MYTYVHTHATGAYVSVRRQRIDVQPTSAKLTALHAAFATHSTAVTCVMDGYHGWHGWVQKYTRRTRRVGSLHDALGVLKGYSRVL